MQEGYRTFGHTADLGLEVWAETPERLHALAALAVSAQVVDPPREAPTLAVRVAIEGDDASDLLVHWLNTTLLEAELHAAAWTACRVERLEAGVLEALLEGVPLDPARHVYLREVKAVSLHGLELSLAPPHCRCRVVLDL